MDKSKHSEEAIISLGKKLIEELELTHTTNTLSRWMAHYLAELIEEAEGATFKEKKRILQQECCEIILKLWSNKEILPINTPLKNLQQLVKLLESLLEKKDRELPLWHNRSKIANESSWSDFMETVKRNSEQIFQKLLNIHLHEDLLKKEKYWLENHAEFLSEAEKKFIQDLEILIYIKKGEISSSSPNGQIGHIDRIERLKYVFDDLESLLEEQMIKFNKLKEKIILKE